MVEVKIGNQIWMKYNLNVDKFRNGDQIPHARTSEEWERAGKNRQAAWCYYDSDPANGEIFGKLYNWYAVKDPRGLAPEGWHIPSDKEWEELGEYVGGENEDGTILKMGRGRNAGGNGNDKFGFSALLGGGRHLYGIFFGIGLNGTWWTTSEHDSIYAMGRFLGYGFSVQHSLINDKELGFSVRCIRDENHRSFFNI